MTQLDDGSHLEFSHWIAFGHHSKDSSAHLIISSQTAILNSCQDWIPTTFAQKKLHSFILTQLDDGSHLEFYHNLNLDNTLLDSDTLLSSLSFTQKHSHSTLTLTQTNSIWFKLIHSHLSWWWQESWILPSSILPSWIQPFYTKLWLKLIQSDSN